MVDVLWSKLGWVKWLREVKILIVSMLGIPMGCDNSRKTGQYFILEKSNIKYNFLEILRIETRTNTVVH